MYFRFLNPLHSPKEYLEVQHNRKSFSFRKISIFSYILFLKLWIVCGFLVQCKDIERPPILGLFLMQGSPQNIGVITSDFGGGGRYNVVDPQAGITLPGLTPIHSDASARFSNGKVYIINRLNQDSVQVLNPNLANLTELQFSVEQGSNPHDILIINPNKAYISRYNRKSILIVNPSNGSRIGEIDLAQFSEKESAGGIPDGLPEMSWMVGYENRVFVTLQRLDRNHPSGFLPPSDKSLLIEIDPTTDRPINEFSFQSTNPFSKPQIVNIFGDPHIVFSVPGKIGFISEVDGGVEAFNLNRNQFHTGFLLDERTVNADVLGVQIKNDNQGFVSVLDKGFNKKILEFNPSTGSIVNLLLEVPNSLSTNFSGMLLTADGLLILGISDSNSPGIMVYDTNGEVRQLTPIPIRTELTPTDLIELR